MWLKTFLSNHVLANSTFAVVLLVGILSYFQMPRAQDPEVNFNWISIITLLPGASAEDVEKLITDPLEEAIRKVQNIKFVSSTSREGIADILVRFEDISQRKFDKRINDLRREIQNKANAELPDEMVDPVIREITTSNNFPTATLILTGAANDELLRKAALNIRKDLERIKGVNNVIEAGFADPELKVSFDPAALHSKGFSPTQLADTVRSYFQDVVAGDMHIGQQSWLVRVNGTSADPGYLASLPIIGSREQVSIGDVAQVTWSHEKFSKLSRFNGRPGVTLALTKQSTANILDLVERVNQYIVQKNAVLASSGLKLTLLDDQTESARDAINIMQNNALLGLILVALITWLFLGAHIAFFIGIGIPFTLAGTFWLLNSTGQTLNQNILLGVVIVLGMLVDDAVVVVEAIYYRIQRGAQSMQAAIDALREVFTPVTASVTTTMAAFLPLMLMPGIVGKFMFVVPFVVSVALAISLIEAYWMLPVHISMTGLNMSKPGKLQQKRTRFTHWLRLKYSKLLIRVLRKPKRSLGVVLALFIAAMTAVGSGMVRVEFFAFDPLRAFYINVEMPPGSTLQDTLNTTQRIADKASKHLREQETRAVSVTAGQMFTETAPFFGDNYGQVFISLHPKDGGMRGVAEIIDAMRTDIMATAAPRLMTFFKLSKGPPVTKAISIKVRGDNFVALRAATDALRNILTEIPEISDISDNDSPGKYELKLQLDSDAVHRSGLNPTDVASTVRLLFDGDVVASMQYESERVEVRVQAQRTQLHSIDQLLETPLALPKGGEITLGQLVTAETGLSRSNIRHYNFRRSITVEAELNKTQMDTLTANQLVMDAWDNIRLQHPSVDLDFSGELADIQESLDSMLSLFLFGIGLIYLIIGTQFKSYWQPFMILATVPLAFTGVTFGLMATGNPLSMFTLYGVVALVGIAVNAAIVMIHAANQRLNAGMSVLHATIYAARRRVVPIIITSLTTVAGLFSLAIGLAGESLIWGPVASAIVWGLAFSTVLTLFVIPLLYRTFMRKPHLPH
ncbi:MAG: efflux RND transporter permease subunit [Ectothiorhodospiraceae bacterium]|nr:efflux RND transporter permease subunit [Ectothiorhodospiraceae bacterium]